jgi:transposase-like protein
MLIVNSNGTSGGRGAERAVGEQSGAAARRPRRTGPDPELAERPSRRRFTAEHKLRIIQEAEACAHGEVGALLRREGLYTSHLFAWRKQRDEGALDALSRPRGRRAPHPLERENADLRRRIERAEAELARARKVIEVQGNVSALLGELLGPRSAKQDESTER